MKSHFTCTILVVFLIGLFAVAQETANNTSPASVFAGSTPLAKVIYKTVKTAAPYGAVNYLPVWTGLNTVTNSALYQSGLNVGIGTTSPASTLDVQGNGNFTVNNTSTTGLQVTSGGSVSAPQLQLNQTNGNDYSRLRFTAGQHSAWDVAVGTSGDTFNFWSWAATGNIFSLSGTGVTMNNGGTANKDTLVLGNYGARALVLFDTGAGVDIASQGVSLNLNFSGSQPTIINGSNSATGYVGIGTVTPDNMLSVFGNADKPGGGSWGTYSDGRLKTVVGSFNRGLSQIMRLHPVRYRCNKENALGIRDEQEHVGLVAQDVQTVIPEAVTENDKGYLLLNNDPVLWSMLNAIKEQQGLIHQQEEQIKQLTRQVREVQAALKARGGAQSAVRTVKAEVPVVHQ